VFRYVYVNEFVCVLERRKGCVPFGALEETHEYWKSRRRQKMAKIYIVSSFLKYANEEINLHPFW